MHTLHLSPVHIQPVIFDDELPAQSHAGPDSYIYAEATGMAQSAGQGEHLEKDSANDTQYSHHLVGPQPVNPT